MVHLLRVRAPAKINLFLRVTGRRADGYHELDSLFAPVAIFDHIAIEFRPAPTPRVSLRCNWADLGPPDHNLAVRAAYQFMRDFDRELAVEIQLDKRIPAGAGLGGGSSDAGAVLRAMAQMTRLDDPLRLRTAALRLGADVPFFLNPCPARVRGIGEAIEPLPELPHFDLVIAAPPINVPTALIFRGLARDGWSGGAPDHLVQSILRGEPDADALRNDLAPVAFAQYPAIAELKRALERAGAHAAAMSGSGGAVFGIYASTAAARAAADKISAEFADARVFATRLLTGADVAEKIAH